MSPIGPIPSYSSYRPPRKSTSAVFLSGLKLRILGPGNSIPEEILMKRMLVVLAALSILIPAVGVAQMSNQMTRVWNDTTRLQAILVDIGNDAEFSAATWRVVGNEANALANRIYGNTGSWRTESRQAARDLRHHVRELRTAALAGNAVEARRHAAEALPFANTLADRIRASM